MNEKLMGISSTLPIEIIYSAGLSVLDLNNVFITNENPGELLNRAHQLGLPRTYCSWTKGVFAAALTSKIRQMIIVAGGDCCHSRIMSEKLLESGVSIENFSFSAVPDQKLLEGEMKLLALSLKTTLAEAEKLWIEFRPIRCKLAELDELTWQLGQVSGWENHLWLISGSDMQGNPKQFSKTIDVFLKEVKQRPAKNPDIRLGVVGIPPIFSDFHSFVQQYDGEILYNELAREFAMVEPANSLVDQYLKYTYPYSLEERIQRIQREVKKRNLDGLVHYTQSFCFHQTEHAMLKSALDIPVLQLEGHEPNQLDGRSRTRLGAFLESFSKKKGNTMNSKICAGLDIGSRSVKVVLSKNGKITKFSRPTSEFYRAFLTAEEKSFSRSFLMDIFPELAGVEQLTVTGYGREKVNWPGAKEITEVLAHALGAMDSSGLADFILVDIGGQDTKIIRVEGGCLTDFELNDRCAAGSGRFMENMAAILNLTMDELDSYDVEPVHLDATCATFGETELVGQILSGASLPALATGVIQAVYERLLPVVRRMEGQNLLLSGGGARIKRLAKLFESGTGMKVITLKEPQYTGALGCLHNSLQQLA